MHTCGNGFALQGSGHRQGHHVAGERDEHQGGAALSGHEAPLALPTTAGRFGGQEGVLGGWLSRADREREREMSMGTRLGHNSQYN